MRGAGRYAALAGLSPGFRPALKRRLNAALKPRLKAGFKAGFEPSFIAALNPPLFAPYLPTRLLDTQSYNGIQYTPSTNVGTANANAVAP